MGMEMKLQVKLSQQLVMTPQLVQAIKPPPALAHGAGRRGPQGARRQPGARGRQHRAQGQRPGLARRMGSSLATATPPARRSATTRDRATASNQHGGSRRKRAPTRRTPRSTGSSYLENQPAAASPPALARSGYDELPPIEQNLTKLATSLQRAPHVAAADVRHRRHRTHTSRRSSSATSTSAATSISWGAKGRTADRAA
jgi:RNA polymerase sigma-54 factor